MSYDPKAKKRMPYRSIVKIFCTLVICVAVMVGVKVQKSLAKKDAQLGVETKKEVASPTKAVDNPFSVANEASIKKAAAKPKMPVVTTDATEEDPDEALPTSNPSLKFNPEKPVLVLSLPHSADLAIARYFKCAGVAPQQMGKYWAQTKIPMGRVMHQNLMNNASVTHNLGDFAVLTEMQHVEAAKTKGKTKHPARCFDPVLFPGALDQLQIAHPNAFIVIVKQDPFEWYSHMPKDIKAHWKKWCNPTHMDLFPTSSHSKTKYAAFYKDYHRRLDDFISQHPGWTPVEIDLSQNILSTASMLERHLQVPSQCWVESVDAPLRIGAGDATLPPQKRPNTIPYPILSVGLPKGGDNTAQAYFRCGLGLWATAQQWSTPSKSTEENPAPDVPIGKCIEDNAAAPDFTGNILKGCGHARFWGDIGYLRDNQNGGYCYYPTMREGVLDKFAEYYPRATILQMVRPAQDWYSSAARFNNLPNRWSAAQQCPSFPAEGSEPQAWHQFYDQHTQSIRDFVARHKNLTYLEIPLSEEGGEMLQEIFQFPKHCWPGNKDDQ